MATHAPTQAPTGMALAMIEGCGSVEKLMKAVEGNAPKTSPRDKKDISMTSTSKPAAKGAKSPIERLYNERSGKKVAVGDMTFLIEVVENPEKTTSLRRFTVVKSKGDVLLGRYISARELDYEQLAYKVNSSIEVFDDRVALHALLRPLAVAAGLAKADKPKASKKHKVKKGRDKVSKPVASPLVRMDTVVAPGSAPLANFGIERLLSAPEGKKVTVGSYSFIIEDGDHEQGPAGRRYVCSKAPDDFGLANWVTDDDVCLRTSPRMPDSLQGQLREAKIVMHQLLRNAAIDAGLVEGKYATLQTAITDQAVVIASIKDAIDGRYVVQHPDFDEDAIVAIELEDGRHGQEMQIILVKGNNEGLDGIKPGTRLAHKAFMKRLRPANMPEFLERFADWLDEAVF